MSVDTDCYNHNSRGWQSGLPLAPRVQTRVAPEYHTMHRTAATSKGDPAKYEYVSGAQAENP